MSAFSVFQNKISTSALIVMTLCCFALIWRAIIFSFHPQEVTVNQPLILNNVKLEQTVLHPGNPLIEDIDGHVNIPDCEAYTLRTVISEATKQEVWVSVSDIQPKGTLADIVNKKKVVVVQIPKLDPGNYIYRAEVHMICSDKSYITIVPLLNFTIVPEGTPTND